MIKVRSFVSQPHKNTNSERNGMIKCLNMNSEANYQIPFYNSIMNFMCIVTDPKRVLGDGYK
jgi:hypothetical protein